MHTCTKTYRDFPAAHRAPNHDGHCSLIHGHNWDFTFVFSAEEDDINGFVVDFGKLGKLKDRLTHLFDHTCLIARDDPKRDLFEDMNLQGLLDLRIVESTCAEALARLAFCEAQSVLDENPDFRKRGARVVRVDCHEDSKNIGSFSI
jgi:6-pyruvoyltetrahydropterin/6-carboxytetrahydropterin synthase